MLTFVLQLKRYKDSKLIFIKEIYILTIIN